ncbi:MAG: Hsp33 family molecular chaperone HslO [Planctomycetes bacterium]|nr:Hsp33 family molecular chaperone HslO [Planctomycetota bacterium]
MTDHISRFVTDDGYALSYVVCGDTAQLMGHAQHKLSADVLAMFSEVCVSALLMATRLKGRGLLSLQLQGDIGRVRTLRCDAMGMGYIRSMAHENAGAEELFGNGTLTVGKQIEGSKQPFQSNVLVNHDRFTHAANAYLHSSEQVQAMILSDVRVQGDMIERARGIYLERLPDAGDETDRPVDQKYEELYEAKRTHIDLSGNDDEAIIASIFGEGQFKKLRSYDVQFYCPCGRERYIETIKQFEMKQITDLCNQQGIISCDCEFCKANYQIALDDVI